MKGITKLAVNVPTAAIDSLRTYAAVHEITMTEALRRALGVQDFLNKELCKGGKVLIEDKRGRFHQLISV